MKKTVSNPVASIPDNKENTQNEKNKTNLNEEGKKKNSASTALPPTQFEDMKSAVGPCPSLLENNILFFTYQINTVVLS